MKPSVQMLLRAGFLVGLSASGAADSGSSHYLLAARSPPLLQAGAIEAFEGSLGRPRSDLRAVEDGVRRITAAVSAADRPARGAVT